MNSYIYYGETMQLNKVLENIAVNVSIAILYFILGFAGLKLGFLSGYATAIYPAAGLAFIAVLCGGIRLLPGVWVGSASINIYVSSTFGDVSFNHLIVAALIGVGSCLQAWFASAMVKRFGRPEITKLTINKDILLFLLLAGPIACLVAASFASFIMLATNTISIDELMSQWLYWWLGDTVGVTLISPLILMTWYRQESWWQGRVKNVFIPTIIALITTILTFYYLNNIEKTIADNRLQKISQSAANTIKTEITVYKEIIRSVARFVQVTPNLQYSDFEKFTSPILNAHPNLHALSWNPHINDSYRAAFELEMGNELNIADFHISQKTVNNQLILATKKDWYTPVTYIIPRNTNKKALGYDIASNPLRREAINQAINTGELVATSPIRLIQESGDIAGILFIDSITSSYFPSIGLTQNSNSSVGFAVGVVRIENLIENLFNEASFKGFKVTLEDKHADTSNTILYSYGKKSINTDFDYVVKKDLNVGGRIWQFTIKATQDSLLTEQSLHAWQILLVGLLLSSFLQILLLIITGQSYSAHQKISQINNDLEKSEKKFKIIFEEAPLGVAVIDSYTGQIYDVNAAYSNISGRTFAELKEINWMAITHPDDVQEDLDNMARMNSGEIAGFTMYKRYIKSDGDIVWINMAVASMMVNDKAKPRHLCMIEDVTQRKGTEDQLKLASLVFEFTEQAISVTDKNNLIVAVNPAFTHLTGYSLSDVIGNDPSILKSDRYDKSFYNQMWKTIVSTGRWQGEIWNKKKNGTEFAELLNINSIYDDYGKLSQRVALFSDITAKKISDEKIWHQANFDGLTQLPNRRMFRDRLAHDIQVSQRTQKPLAIFFMDLDHFKEVNDTLGHDKGDQLLIEVSQRIKDCVRESDTVSRLSGDEFTVILTELEDAIRVERIAEDVIRSLSMPFLFGVDKAYISASVGIAIYPNDAEKIDDLINYADQAMYLAKNNGRNQFSFFTRSMQTSAHDRNQLSIDLRFAIRDKQFQIFYQPIYNFQTNTISNVEALLRWNHPTKGVLYPIDFIPLADETGLITSIGNWVFQQAVLQIKDWQKRFNPKLKISINKSSVEFRSPTNYLKWIDCLNQLEISEKSIILDITESILNNRSDSVKSQLAELTAKGMQIAIDDFGTGYSAISNISKFDINYLKITPEIVQSLTTEPSKLSFCEAIVVMAHKFGLDVIAEGIETEEQKCLLIKAGCDYGQGFLFSKPVPMKAFENLLEHDQIEKF